MVTKQIKELEATKAKIVALEKTIAKRLKKELATLHKSTATSSMNEFVRALKAASGSKAKGPRAGRQGCRKGEAPAPRRHHRRDACERQEARRIREDGLADRQGPAHISSQRPEHQEGPGPCEGARVEPARSCQRRPAPAILRRGLFVCGCLVHVHSLYSSQYERAPARRDRAVDLPAQQGVPLRRRRVRGLADLSWRHICLG
jgi:hypothetical protein